eukprot:SAG31_NODE_14275_length_817_cov_1.033426_1_plen_180_part_10
MMRCDHARTARARARAAPAHRLISDPTLFAAARDNERMMKLLGREETEHVYDLQPPSPGIRMRELGPSASAATEDDSSDHPTADGAATPHRGATDSAVRERCYREKAVDDCTGLSVWASAVVLARWCAANPEELRGKRCIELGAGTGLAGLAAALYCRPASVCLTDFAPFTLANLRHNVQ